MSEHRNGTKALESRTDPLQLVADSLIDSRTMSALLPSKDPSGADAGRAFVMSGEVEDLSGCVVVSHFRPSSHVMRPGKPGV